MYLMKVKYWPKHYFVLIVRFMSTQRSYVFYRKFSYSYDSLVVTYRQLCIKGFSIFFDTGTYRVERSQYGFRSLLTDKERHELEDWSMKTGNAFCVYCGNKLGTEDDDLVDGMYCPRCEKGFPLVVERMAQ
jgi:hypothetical protein